MPFPEIHVNEVKIIHKVKRKYCFQDKHNEKIIPMEITGTNPVFNSDGSRWNYLKTDIDC